jgi:nitrogen fixation protein FixH
MKSIIIFSVIAALMAVFGAVFIGIQSFDGTVTDSPYEDGLVWDELQKKRAVLGWQVAIKEDSLFVGKNEAFFFLTDKDGNPLSGSSITLMISRPSTSIYDMRFESVKVEEGVFKAAAEFPLYGYWDIHINVTKGPDSILFKERVFIEKS